MGLNAAQYDKLVEASRERHANDAVAQFVHKIGEAKAKELFKSLKGPANDPNGVRDILRSGIESWFGRIDD